MKTIVQGAEEWLSWHSSCETTEKDIFKAGAEFAQRWIPIEEELPEIKDETYKILIKNDSVDIMFITRYTDIELLRSKELGVTHWRPIELN